MIDIKPSENLLEEYQKAQDEKDLEICNLKLQIKGMENSIEYLKSDEINRTLNPDAYYLKEISKTLKDILKEMKKRKA